MGFALLKDDETDNFRFSHRIKRADLEAAVS